MKHYSPVTVLSASITFSTVEAGETVEVEDFVVVPRLPYLDKICLVPRLPYLDGICTSPAFEVGFGELT